MAFHPGNEPLEERALLTTFDLSTTQTAPLGVQFVGKSSDNTAGYTVTDVGNVTGSGYDSFVISAPGLPANKLNMPTFDAATESAAYLVFGSKQVNINTVADYLKLANGTTNGVSPTITGGNRAGDLGELGTLGVATTANPNPTAQTNPTVAQPQPPLGSTHVYGFNFDGLTFVTGLDSATGLGRASGLGFSVTPLGDLTGNGFDDFAISAPNDAGGGKVFVIYGGTALTTQAVTNKTIDLEPTPGTNATTTPTKVVTFSIPNAASGTDVGYSVAGIGNFFNTSTGRDLAIGVPGLTVGGNADAGAVFAIAGQYINGLATGTNVNLTTVGNGTNSQIGIEYTGVSAGNLTGFSVATAGNFDGQVGSGSPLDDLLIGAPGANFGGGAYLVYASQSYLPNMTRGTTISLSTLGAAATTNPVTNPLQGITFADQGVGDDLGWAVASAGDFNDDGVDDILLGAPGYNASTGYAYVAYGQAGTTTSNPTRINGIFVLNPLTATTGITGTSFIGQALGDYTGWSLATTTNISFGTTSTNPPAYDILIGAPGAVGGGEAYLVPGTATGATLLALPQMLSNINTSLNGSLFNVSGTSDPAIVNGYFGRSVSARNPVIDANTEATTVDGDAVPDLFFGAPASSLLDPVTGLTDRTLSGVAYVVEGGLAGGTSSGGSSGTTSGATITTSFNTIVNALNPVIFTGDDNGLPNPPVSALSKLISYAPLPVQLAEQQFRPAPGFVAREAVYHKPTSEKKGAHSAPAGSVLQVSAIRGSENEYSKVNTLRPGVRTRSKTKVGTKTTFTHKVKVIPSNQQTETYPG